MVEGAFLFPVDSSQCHVLSAIVSQLSPHGSCLWICGCKDISSVMDSDNRQATNYLWKQSRFCFYEVICHVSFFLPRGFNTWHVAVVSRSCLLSWRYVTAIKTTPYFFRVHFVPYVQYTCSVWLGRSPASLKTPKEEWRWADTQPGDFCHIY